MLNDFARAYLNHDAYDVHKLTALQFNCRTSRDGMPVPAAPTHFQNFAIGVLVRRCERLLHSFRSAFAFHSLASALAVLWKAR